MRDHRAPTPLYPGAKYVHQKPSVSAREPWAFYWEYADGSEGGELWLAPGLVQDYDGAFDLPQYVADELNAAGYRTPWREEAA
jgi:hypothetical protein